VRAALLGLDLGTTTVTGVLFDSEDNKVLRLARRRNDAALPSGQPTRSEQAPRRMYQRAIEVLADLAEAGQPVSGLAVTGQKHGLLCVASGGEPLAPLITWQDQRTAEVLPAGKTTLAQLRDRLADLDWRVNGCHIQHGYGGATLFWLVQQSQLPSSTQCVCTVASWLAGQLTGQPPVSDPSFAASWGLYDLRHGAWNDAFLARLGLDRGILPPVRPAGEALGGLEAGIARKAGLPAGLPVYNPLGDTQASFLGSTADSDPAQTILVNLGTGGQVCWAVPAFEAPSERVETRPLPGEAFLRVGASLCGGEAYAWLNRTVRSWLAAFDTEAGEEMVYERLNGLAASCENTAGLRVRTTFQGVRGDPQVEAGSIEGIPVERLDLGALARATLQGIVDELHDLYSGHARSEAGHRQVVAAGGAVERNPLLLEMIGERFGLPVQVPPFEETAAVGAAMLAAEIRSGSA
jgi:sugar (pentulose or hexulose) kinase